MILGVSLEMEESEREIVTREMIKGFNDKANEAGTKVTGGQSVMNPWPIIGGVAMSVVPREEVIFPNNSKEGDIIFLTKPLGTQVIVNIVQWFTQGNHRWEKVRDLCGITEPEMWKTFNTGARYMASLNLYTAKVMKKYKVHACTDVTGFGIKGHCENLVKCQVDGLKFIIKYLPILAKMNLVNEKVLGFKLLEGYSAETSGGLLIIIDKNDAEDFLKEMEENKLSCWEIGYVEKGNREVEISAEVINV